MANTFNIRIGGEAGQGLVSIGSILMRAAAREGWYLFAHQDYESRIRGGHNFFQIRLGSSPPAAGEDRLDLVVSLDQATIPRAQEHLTDDSLIIYDPDLFKAAPPFAGGQENVIAIRFVQVTEKWGSQNYGQCGGCRCCVGAAQ